MTSDIVPRAASVLAEIESENPQWAGVAGAALQGEMRMLRTVIELVIKPMAKQLSP